MTQNITTEEEYEGLDFRLPLNMAGTSSMNCDNMHMHNEDIDLHIMPIMDYGDMDHPLNWKGGGSTPEALHQYSSMEQEHTSLSATYADEGSSKSKAAATSTKTKSAATNNSNDDVNIIGTNKTWYDKVPSTARMCRIDPRQWWPHHWQAALCPN
jgi:hypothetical protein